MERETAYDSIPLFPIFVSIRRSLPETFGDPQMPEVIVPQADLKTIQSDFMVRISDVKDAPNRPVFPIFSWNFLSRAEKIRKIPNSFRHNACSRL